MGIQMRKILKGGEPFFFPGDEVGCLLTHGFTATPQEVRELGEYLASQGRTVLGVRLFGHAADVRDMPRARWRDWIASVEDGYYLLKDSCSRIVLLGLSTGGAISLVLAHSLPTIGVVAMSTPHELPSDLRIRLLRPVIKPVSLLYPYNPKGPSDFVDLEAQRNRVQYNYYPLRAVPELDALFSKMREILPQLHLPVLFIHSKEDKFVPPKHMEANFNLLGSRDKDKILIEGSNHNITCDAAREQVFMAANEFVNRIAGK
jgi:carboxylesterase